MRKINLTIPVELNVLLLFVLIIFQSIFTAQFFHEDVQIYLDLICVSGVIVGLIGTSLFVATLSTVMVGVGVFVLYFFPFVISTPFKLYLIAVFPVFAALSFWCELDISFRKHVISDFRQVKTYLASKDGHTHLNNLENFKTEFESLSNSLHLRSELNHELVATFFKVDYFNQYEYQDKEKAYQLIQDISKDLTVIRFPEEYLFYIGKATFLILSATSGKKHSEEIRKLNRLTQTQLLLLPFDKTHNISLRMASITLSASDTYTAEQVISLLYRRSEADIPEEYII